MIHEEIFFVPLHHGTANIRYRSRFYHQFFLPDGMIDWFEVVNMTEENNPGTTIADKLYNRILNIYLDERDNRSEDQMGLKPNGFTEATVIKDYPIRNRKVLLHVRRRRYLELLQAPSE